MKTLFAFLMAISCTALSFARCYVSTFYFNPELPVSYEYNKTATTAAEKCTDKLIAGERFRVLLVRDKRFTVTGSTQPAVAIDPAGNVVVLDKDNVLGTAWCKLNSGYDSVQCATDAQGGSLGVPGKMPDGMHGFTAYLEDKTDLPGEGGAVYRYLVVTDTRVSEFIGEEEEAVHNYTSGEFIACYAMTLCPASSSRNYLQVFDAPQDYDIYVPDEKWDFCFYLNWPGYDFGWQSAVYDSLTVTQDGVEKILTGDELGKYLTPRISMFEKDENVLSLTATAPDVQYYTLYTKAHLDDEWELFEKLLDNNSGKRYTRFRIDGESFSIPLFDGEASRFYMLRGE